jgi:hypothetical protein
MPKTQSSREQLADEVEGAGHLHSTRFEKRTEQQTLTIERIKMVDRHVGKCCHLFEVFALLFRERADLC